MEVDLDNRMIPSNVGGQQDYGTTDKHGDTWGK
jgi:hypothetical protein